MAGAEPREPGRDTYSLPIPVASIENVIFHCTEPLWTPAAGAQESPAHGEGGGVPTYA